MSDHLTQTAERQLASSVTTADYLELLYQRTPEGYIGVSWVDDQDNFPSKCFPVETQLAEAAAFAEAKGKTHHTYTRVCLLDKPLAPYKRGTAADSRWMPAVWLDLDTSDGVHAKEDLPHPTREEAMGLLKKVLPVKPSILVDSGGGYYPLYLLDEPLDLHDDTDKATALDLLARIKQAALIEFTKAERHLDKGVFELARVLRVPGSLNHKFTPPRPAQVLRMDDLFYPVDDLLQYLPEVTVEKKPEGKRSDGSPEDQLKALQLMAELPGAIVDCYEDWIKVGQILHSVDDGNMLLAAWDAWSQNSEKYTPGKCAEKWKTFNSDHENAAGIGSLVHMVRECQSDDASSIGAGLATKPGDMVRYTGETPDMPQLAQRNNRKLDSQKPYETAKLFLLDLYGNNPPRLHYWRGDFYFHDGRAYRVATPDRLRAELYEYVDGAFDPTKNRTANLIDATKAAAYLSEATDAPQWIGDDTGRPRASECLPVNNGILHLPTRKIYEHDPALFALNALSFDFDATATCPAWLAFMKSVWGDDIEQINALQEWLGYLISSETGQQKIGLVVGPKRSGKGTIGRVMTELLGAENVCAPTLAGLETNFGLQPLIGKIAATISDARLSGRADQSKIAERLLSISGEDSVTIDRKHRDAWTGTLGARFTIMTNELPRLADASGALASRFVVMVMRKSFYGREDAGLTARLLGELPGIFNWTLAGLDRLRDRGHFVQPSSSEDAIEELVELGSPVGAFVEEACVVEPGAEIQTETLYREWSKWCEEHGRSQPGTAASFGRDLRAAVSGLNTRRPRLDTGERIRVYEGIRLRF